MRKIYELTKNENETIVYLTFKEKDSVAYEKPFQDILIENSKEISNIQMFEEEPGSFVETEKIKIPQISISEFQDILFENFDDISSIQMFEKYFDIDSLFLIKKIPILTYKTFDEMVLIFRNSVSLDITFYDIAVEQRNGFETFSQAFSQAQKGSSFFKSNSVPLQTAFASKILEKEDLQNYKEIVKITKILELNSFDKKIDSCTEHKNLIKTIFKNNHNNVIAEKYNTNEFSIEKQYFYDEYDLEATKIELELSENNIENKIEKLTLDTEDSIISLKTKNYILNLVFFKDFKARFVIQSQLEILKENDTIEIFKGIDKNFGIEFIKTFFEAIKLTRMFVENININYLYDLISEIYFKEKSNILLS